MAADYALLLSVAEGLSPPVIRFYSWASPIITIGYFQDAGTEADLAECAASDVGLIRRATGGGAVFHEHEITYSMIFPAAHPFAGTDILDSYTKTLKPFIQALSAFGLDAQHSPVNDIEISGLKISGNAQTRRKETVLQHGTILIDIDRPKAFRCLTVPEEKTRRKKISSPSMRVTCLKDHLGEKALSHSFAGEFIDAVTASLHESSGVKSVPSFFSDRETAETKRIEATVFADERWNLYREGELP
jgi:lipoate-protein ligase A